MRAELLLAGFVFVFSGFLFYETTKFPDSGVAAIGPEYWPQLILGGMIIFSLSLLVYIILHKEQYSHDNDEALPHPKNFWITIAAAVVYTLALPTLGFPIATLFLIAALLFMLKIRDWKRLTLYSFGFTLAIVMLFPKFMGVALPRGDGFFRVISLFFY